MKTTHIVAMGGGGFSTEPDNPLLDDFILGLTGKPKPRVCFLPTASGDSDGYIVRFYESFPADRCDPSHIRLTNPRRDLREFVLAQDVLYVGGGNTANLLAVWRVHGLDQIVREAWESGVVLCGPSAGALCWFEGGVTDSFGPLWPLDDGLGLLPGSFCPHYDVDTARRPAYQRLVGEGALEPGHAADDGAALHFVGTQLREVVSSRTTAAGYRVQLTGGVVMEEPLTARFLGATG